MSTSNTGNVEADLYSLFNKRDYIAAYDLVVKNPELIDGMTGSEIRGFYQNLRSLGREEASKFLNVLEERVKGIQY